MITHQVERLAIGNGEGAVLFIDLNGFRKINDAFGHRLGDKLLREVGQRIVKNGLLRSAEDLN